MNHAVMVAARIPLAIHDATTTKSTRKDTRPLEFLEAIRH